MALNDITKVNGVDKLEVLRGFEYDFPLKTILADNNRELVEYRPKFGYTPPRVILFEDIPDKKGATTPEQYVDQLAVEGFFFLNSEVPNGLGDYFQNELAVYTLFEVIPNGNINGALSQQIGINILVSSFKGLDLNIQSLSPQNYPTGSPILDSNADIVTGTFNPTASPPNWELQNPDTGGNDYALIFRIQGTRQNITTYLTNNPQYRSMDDRGLNLGVGGGTTLVSLDTLQAETNQTLSPSINRAAGWVDVVWGTSTPENDSFVLEPDNITIRIKTNFNPTITANLNFISSNGNNNRRVPQIRGVISIDGGLNFTPLTNTLSSSYIRNSNVNIEFSTCVITSKRIDVQGNTDALIRLQFQLEGENANSQISHTTGYFNFISLTNEANVIPVAPVIANPLPDPLNIPASQLFVYDLGILNATNVQLFNAPPNSTITNDGILTIQSPFAANYPNFEVRASNNAPNPTVNAVNLTIGGFQNLLRVSLNGTNQFLRTDDNNTLDYRYNQRNCISFWVEFNGVSREPIIEKYDYSLARGLYIDIDIDRRIRFRFAQNSTNFLYLKYDFQFQNNVKYHLCFNFFAANTNEVEMYIDGSLNPVRTIFTDNLVIGDTRNSNFFYVGHNSNSGATLQANIDELVSWTNRTITPAQIAEIYNFGLPLDMSTFSGTTPQNWWRMGEGSLIPNINNEQSTSPDRVLQMVNADNNIIPF